MFNLSKLFPKKVCPNCLPNKSSIPAGTIAQFCRKCKPGRELIHFRLPDGNEFYVVAVRPG